MAGLGRPRNAARDRARLLSLPCFRNACAVDRRYSAERRVRVDGPAASGTRSWSSTLLISTPCGIPTNTCIHTSTTPRFPRKPFLLRLPVWGPMGPSSVGLEPVIQASPVKFVAPATSGVALRLLLLLFMKVDDMPGVGEAGKWWWCSFGYSSGALYGRREDSKPQHH